MSLRLTLLLVGSLALAGCGLTAQQKADYNAVQRSQVSPAIYDKMVHGDDLSTGDITALSRAGVNPGVILRYLRDHDTIYVLSSSDVTRMRQAGVSESLVDYMLRTPEYYSSPPVVVGLGFGFGYDDYWGGGYGRGYGRGYRGYGGRHWH